MTTSLPTPALAAQAGVGLLIRSNFTTGRLVFYRCWTPRSAALAQLVRVAEIRWTVEESFQAAKSHVDQHQIRRWRTWHQGHHSGAGRPRRSW